MSSWLFETLRPETEISKEKHTDDINQTVSYCFKVFHTELKVFHTQLKVFHTQLRVFHTGRKDKLNKKDFLAAIVVIQSLVG